MSNEKFKVKFYLKGSYIFMEGSKSESFYIVRQGNVKLSCSSNIIGEEKEKVIGPGDFFGVISAMGRYPHLENAIALTKVSLIEIEHNNFHLLLQKNYPIALKIIRFFSTKLRVFDEYMDTLKADFSFQSVVHSPSEMIKMGEFYLNNNEKNKSLEIFQRFFIAYPNSNLVDKVRKILLEKFEQEFTVQKQPASKKLLRIVQNNSLIFCEHEPGHELYIIKKGNVKITKIIEDREVVLSILKIGDIFGEMSLLEDKPRSASAFAIENVDLITINKLNFKNLVLNQTKIATKIILMLSERIWKSYKQLFNIHIKDPEGKILDILFTLIESSKNTERLNYNFGIKPEEILSLSSFKTDINSYFINKTLQKHSKIFKFDEKNNIVCVNIRELENITNIFRKKYSKNIGFLN